MAKVKAKNSSGTPRKRKPALTPEARENQMIDLATSVAEEQLLNGTASSQIITHYLRLGTTKMELEREKLRAENELLKAKTEALESAKRIEELYRNAMSAFRGYSGQGAQDEDLFRDDFTSDF